MLAVAVAGACTPVKGGPRGPKVLLVGDSIAYGFAPALGAALGGRPFESAAVSGCGIVRGRTYNWDGTEHPYAAACDAVIWGRHEEFLQSFDPDIVVWLGIVELLPHAVDNGLYTPGPIPGPGTYGPAADAKLVELMNEAWGHLQSRGARLVVLTMPPPTTSVDYLDQRTVHLNALLRYFASLHPENTKLIDLAALVCPGGLPCPEQIDGITLRKPDFHTHFTDAGAAYIAAGIAQLILNS